MDAAADRRASATNNDPAHQRPTISLIARSTTDHRHVGGNEGYGAEYGESEWVTTHHAQRKYLMKRHLPPTRGWSIWIAHYRQGNPPMLWFASPFLVLPERVVAHRGHRHATYYNGHASTRIIGELLIHIIRSPHPRLATMFRFHLPRRQAIFRIWPPNVYGLTWPAGTIDDASASYIADAVKEFSIRSSQREPL